MGLDITAYSNLEYVGHVERPEEPGTYPSAEYAEYEAWMDEHVEAYCYKGFERHALMGVPNVRQADDHGAFVSAGYFVRTPATEVHGFRAGSYGGYNWWRNDMREKYNPDVRPEGPFYGLINFADNEGTLCEMVCASLLLDFRQHEQAHRLSWMGSESCEYQMELYADWIRAFALGAKGGLVDFH